MEWNWVEISNRSYDLQIREVLPRWDLSSASAMICSWVVIPSAGNRPWRDLILLAKWPRNIFIMIGKGIGLWWDFGIRKMEINCTYLLGENKNESTWSRARRDPDTNIGLVEMQLRLLLILEQNTLPDVGRLEAAAIAFWVDVDVINWLGKNSNLSTRLRARRDPDTDIGLIGLL